MTCETSISMRLQERTEWLGSVARTGPQQRLRPRHLALALSLPLTLRRAGALCAPCISVSRPPMNSIPRYL